MTIDWRNTLIVALCLTLFGACVIVFTLETNTNKLEKQNNALIVQNVQLTKDVTSAKADAFRDGLITCGNEDIKWLNEQADYYRSLAGANPLSKLMAEWAQTWAYDDETLNEMTESYMDGGTE